MSELKKDYVTICEYCGNEIKSLRRGKRFCDGSCRVNMFFKLKRDKAVQEATETLQVKVSEVNAENKILQKEVYDVNEIAKIAFKIKDEHPERMWHVCKQEALKIFRQR